MKWKVLQKLSIIYYLHPLNQNNMGKGIILEVI